MVVAFTATPYDADGNALDAGGFMFGWDFGDRRCLAGPGVVEVSHRYDLPEPTDDGGESVKASRRASVTLTDAQGESASAEVTINLRPPEEHFPVRAALLAAVGGMLLIGGLALCVLVALKQHGRPQQGQEA